MIKKKIVKKLNSSPGASVKQQKPNQQQTQKNIQKQNAPVQKNNSQAEGKYASMTQEEYLELQRHAREMEMKIWCTEAYGVALTLKTYFKDRKPIVLGWMPEPNSGKNGAYLTEAYMRTLRASGFPEMRYIAIDNFPPIGVSQSDQVKKIVNALRKVGNADLIIYRNAPIPSAYFESGYAENGYKFFTTNEL